ncbi:MAG: SpoIID/LytB domain-containing protein [bacterium]
MNTFRVARIALAGMAAAFWQACLQPAPPVKYYDKEPAVRVGLLLNHREIYLNLPEKFSIHDAQDNILAKDLLGKKWRVGVASSTAAAASLEMREIGGTQSFVFPSGFEIQTGHLAAADHESGLGNGATRYYTGRMRFIHNGQNISAINILPVEEYLRGVVPAEMSASFPTEALKAQAVACRSEVLYRLQATSRQEYDICADEGCQVYAGTSRQAESVDKAIRATRGLVLKSGGQVASAPYAGVCGGFTENNEAVWSGKPRSYLRSRFDGKKDARSPQSLNSDEGVRQWLEQEARANCNLSNGEAPRSLAYARGYFRWQRQISAAEMAGSIKRKTNEDAGTLLELLPLQRGASGRVTKIRVVGSRKSFEIGGELAIRQALSPQALPSALFVVDKAAGSANGGSAEFLIRGGGWGHGVGMCQVGAAMQALQGRLYQNILEFYYKNARLARAY